MEKQEIIQKAQAYFDEGYACSQAILLSFADHFLLDEETAKKISSTFGGGMGRLREKCGAITGGFMVIGLAFGNSDPRDMKTKLAAYEKVRELNRQVEMRLGTTKCAELLQKKVTPEEIEKRKHHKIICRKVVGEVAGMLYEMIMNNSRITENID
ncbi:MAG: C-GCAxxG-C-C family protein [Bacteroidales bacterium]